MAGRRRMCGVAFKAKVALAAAENLALMREIDRLSIKLPFFGTRKPRKLFGISRMRAQRLRRLMGLEVVCPKRSTSRPAPGHMIYLYLLRNMAITKPG